MTNKAINFFSVASNGIELIRFETKYNDSIQETQMEAIDFLIDYMEENGEEDYMIEDANITLTDVRDGAFDEYDMYCVGHYKVVGRT